jgi:maleamate amidohydrolase
VRQNIDTLLVTGCTTSGCVRATIVDGFSFGFRVQVVADCCGDAEEGPHNDTLRDVGRRYADIIDRATAERYFDAVGTRNSGKGTKA